MELFEILTICFALGISITQTVYVDCQGIHMIFGAVYHICKSGC